VKLFARNFIRFVFFIFLSFFFSSVTFAVTTPFRSANIITTDTSGTFYTNLNNCSVTDGNTCDRATAALYGNLYFRDFGNYVDFGIPSGSTITKIRIRVTGKANTAIYVGLSFGSTFSANCQWPFTLWTLGQLSGSTINTQTFITDVVQQSYVYGTALAYCLQPYNFENKNFIFRINYSSGQNWSANIDNFEVAFDYNPSVTPTPTSTPTSVPTPSPTLTPTPTPKTPLILIPGIGGSELKTTGMKVWAENNGHGGTFNYLYPKDETVWVNESKMGEFGEDDYYDVLKMQNDGVTSMANVGINGNLVARAYQGTIDFFVSNGYTLNKDFFVFPYDWRKDISGTKDFLDQEIVQIKTQTGSAKVDIIAHSMGGLVARNYIADSLKAKNVRKLFTLGTPHLGSVDSLKNLRYGTCLTPLPVSLGLLCLGLIDMETKDIVQNMVSIFQLVPSQSYFSFYSGEDNQHPYPYKIASEALSYAQIKNLLASLNFNTSLFNPSEVFHTLDNSLSNANGVDVIVIAGSGQPTLGQIIETNNHKDILNINGDGTVPLFSASLVDSDKNKSLLGNAKVFYTNQKHGDLITFGSALNLVKNILEDNDRLPDGASTQAHSLPLIWWIFSVHSPVNMNIYDSSGNHTGLTSDGDIEANISGSSYDALGDAKFILAPDDGIYTIKFVATDQGSFDFKIKKYEKNTLSREILYKDIPLTKLTKGETQFDTSSGQSPVIHLDKDGNGTIDEDINPYSAITVTADSNSNSNSNNSITSVIAPVSAVTSPSPSIYVKSNEKSVLGAQTTFQKEEEKTNLKFLNEKKKTKSSLIILSTILIGVAAVIFIKLRR